MKVELVEDRGGWKKYWVHHRGRRYTASTNDGEPAYFGITKSNGVHQSLRGTRIEPECFGAIARHERHASSAGPSTLAVIMTAAAAAIVLGILLF